METHVHIPSVWEAEAEEPEIHSYLWLYDKFQGYPWLYDKFQTKLSYMRPYYQKKFKFRKKNERKRRAGAQSGTHAYSF